jgi:hypothetical protein
VTTFSLVVTALAAASVLFFTTAFTTLRKTSATFAAGMSFFSCAAGLDAATLLIAGTCIDPFMSANSL